MVQAQIDKIIECLLVEYRESAGFFKHACATLWQVTGFFFAGIIIILGWMVSRGQIGPRPYWLLTSAIVLWFLFVLVINYYAEIAEKRCKSIECKLNGLVQNLNMELYGKYADRHKKGDLISSVRIRWLLRLLAIGMIITLWGGYWGWIK